jgi:hypothetical protein
MGDILLKLKRFASRGDSMIRESGLSIHAYADGDRLSRYAKLI